MPDLHDGQSTSVALAALTSRYGSNPRPPPLCRTWTCSRPHERRTHFIICCSMLCANGESMLQIDRPRKSQQTCSSCNRALAVLDNCGWIASSIRKCQDSSARFMQTKRQATTRHRNTSRALHSSAGTEDVQVSMCTCHFIFFSVVRFLWLTCQTELMCGPCEEETRYKYHPEETMDGQAIATFLIHQVSSDRGFLHASTFPVVLSALCRLGLKICWRRSSSCNSWRRYCMFARTLPPTSNPGLR